MDLQVLRSSKQVLVSIDLMEDIILEDEYDTGCKRTTSIKYKGIKMLLIMYIKHYYFRPLLVVIIFSVHF